MHDLSVFFLVTFVTCVTPGAGILFTITSALRGGRAAAWQAPLGNCLGSGLIAVLTAAGLGALLTASPTLFLGFKTLSALLLLWLGWRAWSAPGTSFASLGAPNSPNAAKAPEEGEGRKLPSYLIGSFLLQLANPMLYVYLLSLLPQFISPADDYTARATFLIAIFSATGLVVHLGYSYTAAAARRFFRTPQASRRLNQASGVIFWILGLSVLWKSFA